MSWPPIPVKDWGLLEALIVGYSVESRTLTHQAEHRMLERTSKETSRLEKFSRETSRTANALKRLTYPAGKRSETVSSSKPSSSADSSGNNSSGSPSPSNDRKADQVGQRQNEQGGANQVDTGMKQGERQNAKAIKGEVLRIEGSQYFVAGEDGKEVGLHIDGTTQKTGDIQAGDRIEAQANEQNHALSIRSAPTTDRRNEHAPDVLCAGKDRSTQESGDRVDDERCK